MGRYYVKKSTGGNYSSENLNKALADLGLQKGQSYAIPRRTLQRHMKGPVREPGCTKLGRSLADSEQFYLKKCMETEIVHHAIDMQQRFYGQTPRAGYEPTTIRLKDIVSTHAPPRPTNNACICQCIQPVYVYIS